MLDYTIITRNRVYESEPEDILAEQQEKRKILGLDKPKDYLCHLCYRLYGQEKTKGVFL